MRQITSKHDEDKKKRKNQLIVGGILIFIMLFSVIGYGFIGREKEVDNSKKIVYNGYEFVNKNERWFLELGDFAFAFKYSPEEVPKIPSEINYLDKYSRKSLYISSENKEAELEIYNNLNQIALRMQPACFEKNCSENFPVKTCENNFIIIKETNRSSSIIQENNCVFITGPRQNLTQIADEFLFKVMGIEQ